MRGERGGEPLVRLDGKEDDGHLGAVKDEVLILAVVMRHGCSYHRVSELLATHDRVGLDDVAEGLSHHRVAVAAYYLHLEGNDEAVLASSLRHTSLRS